MVRQALNEQLGLVSQSTHEQGFTDWTCIADCLAEERGVPKEQVKTWIPYPGGAPANVAAALGRLGVKVNFVSAVGQDDLGEQMLDLLNSKPAVHLLQCTLPEPDGHCFEA